MWSYIFFQAKHCRPGRAALCGCKSGGEIIVKLGVKLELKGKNQNSKKMIVNKTKWNLGESNVDRTSAPSCKQYSHKLKILSKKKYNNVDIFWSPTMHGVGGFLQSTSKMIFLLLLLDHFHKKRTLKIIVT